MWGMTLRMIAPLLLLRLKWTMMGKMAIATALRGFNDLGRKVTPTFLPRSKLNWELSTYYPNMNKNLMREVKKNQGICPRGFPSLDKFPGCSKRRLDVSREWKYKRYVPPTDIYGTSLSGIGVWFYFTINELLVVWFSIMDYVLGVFHPWSKRLSFAS